MLLLLALAAPASADVPLPPHFEIVKGACPDDSLNGGGGECAYPDGHIYLLEDKFHPTYWLRAHALGHVFAAELLSPYDHQRFSRLINVYGSWRGPDVDANGFPSGPLSEDFADAYGACLLNVPASRWSGYGYEPSGRMQRRVCAWIRRVAAR